MIATPGEWKTTPTAAKYKTVTDRKLVEPCRWEWRRNSDCEVPEVGGSDDDGAAVADATEDAASDDAEGKDLGAPPAGAVEK